MTLCDEDIHIIAALAVQHQLAGPYDKNQTRACIAFASRIHPEGPYDTFNVNPDAYLPIQKVTALVRFLDASREIPGWEENDEHALASKLLLMTCKELEGFGAPPLPKWVPAIMNERKQNHIRGIS